MAPKKLTEADKTSILSLYRQPQETTSTLAERYGVSNSTISRLLKASLPEAEYSVLIQQKRGSADRAVVVSPVPFEAEPAAQTEAKPRRKQKTKPSPAAAAEPEADAAPAPAPEPPVDADPAPAPPPTTSAKPTRKRRSPAAEPEEPAAVTEAAPEPTQLSIPEPAAEAAEKPARPVLKSAQSASVEAPPSAERSSDEATADLDDDWDDGPVLGEDYEDDSDSDDDNDNEGDDNAYDWEGGDRTTTSFETLEISPLTADALPPLCYVVVERTSSELVVLPLSTFAELGQIPETEGDARTLPVFENHNVARRFSRRNQRVIKVPDGSLLQTTSPYLQAKGITRLFIDGQVFSLGPDPLPEPLADSVGPAAPILND